MGREQIAVWAGGYIRNHAGGQWFKTEGWILQFQLREKQWTGVLLKKVMLDQRPYIEWYQVKITTETNRITAAN